MNARVSLGITAALVAFAGVSGCASTATTQSISADRALCQQATAQAQRGDLAWSATLGRMTNLVDLQICRDNINEFVFGSMNGGRN